MKYLFSAFVLLMAFQCSRFAEAQTIFSGNDIKAMKYNVDLFGRSKIMGLNVNPSSVSTAAPLGSIGMDYLTGNTYVKTTSSATGWERILVGSLNQNYISFPTTASSSYGLILQNGVPIFHTFTNTNGGQGNNIFLGQNAGNFTLSASYGDNIGIGDGALGSITSGYANGAFGYNALHAATVNRYSTAIGDQSLFLSTSIQPNTAVGAHSMGGATSADYNTCVGTYCLLTNATGQANTCVGDSCMNDYNSASNTGFNTGVGFSSLRNLTTGVQNAALGSWTGSQTTQLNAGSYNTLLGYATGPGVGFESMNYSTALGYLTKVSRSNATNIGSQAGHRVGILRPAPESTLDIGGDLNLLGLASAPSLSSGASGKIYFDSVANKFYASENGGAFVQLVANPNYVSIPSTSSSTVGVILQNGYPVWNTYGTSSLFLGKNAGNFTNSASYSTCIGEGSCAAVTTGIINVALGYQANESVQDGADNIAIGYRALHSNVSASHLIAIGNQAMGLNTGASNYAIGYGALNANTTGTFNLALGEQSLATNQIGLANTTVGHYSNNTGTGDGNSSFGFGALRGITTGTHNSGIGRDAGYYSVPNTTGSYNTYLGTNTHPSAGNFDYSTAVGYNAIVGQSNSVILGQSTAKVGIGERTAPVSTLDLAGDINIVESSAPSLSDAGSLKIHANSSTHRLMASANGGAFGQIFPITVSSPEGILPVANGGTGSSTASAARTALGIDVDQINISLNGNGDTIATGIVPGADYRVNKALTVNGWYIIGDQSGCNLVVDVWRVPGIASMPAVVSNSITGSEKPTLTASRTNSDTSLTTWGAGLNLAVGDILMFNVDSASSCNAATIQLTGVRP